MSIFKKFRRKHNLSLSALIFRFRQGILFLLTPDWKLHWKFVSHYQARHKEFSLLLNPKTFNQKKYFIK
jgi:hypothetical protein